MNYTNKTKLIVLFLLAIIAYNLFHVVREGYTSCTQFTDCESCINGYVNNTDPSDFKCFWNSGKKKCGSFEQPPYKDDPGYSRKCSASSGGGGGGGGGGSDVADDDEDDCPVCPQLYLYKKGTILKRGTFVTSQK
jgi:hypothetical protein